MSMVTVGVFTVELVEEQETQEGVKYTTLHIYVHRPCGLHAEDVNLISQKPKGEYVAVLDVTVSSDLNDASYYARADQWHDQRVDRITEGKDASHQH